MKLEFGGVAEGGGEIKCGNPSPAQGRGSWDNDDRERRPAQSSWLGRVSGGCVGGQSAKHSLPAGVIELKDGCGARRTMAWLGPGGLSLRLVP